MTIFSSCEVRNRKISFLAARFLNWNNAFVTKNCVGIATIIMWYITHQRWKISPLFFCVIPITSHSFSVYVQGNFTFKIKKECKPYADWYPGIFAFLSRTSLMPKMESKVKILGCSPQLFIKKKKSSSTSENWIWWFFSILLKIMDFSSVKYLEQQNAQMQWTLVSAVFQ